MIEDHFFVEVPVLEQLPLLLRGGAGAREAVRWRRAGVVTGRRVIVCSVWWREAARS